MKKCLLCERKMLGNGNFGKSCLKKSYNFLGKYDSKTMRTEQTLNEEILKLYNKKNLQEEQNALLVDRYLTLNILNKVNIPAYDTYRTAIQNDINLIDNKTKKKDLKSFNLITLKQSTEVYKIYQKYEKIFQKIMNGDYDFEQNIIFDAIRFAFSKYYSKKPYLSGELQVLQYGILQAGVIFLTALQCNLSAKLLEYSLKSNPKDIIITENKYIKKIQNNDVFKSKIDEIIQKYGTNNYFDTGTENEAITFEGIKGNGLIEKKDSVDLFLAIHNGFIQAVGKKNEDSTWNLEVTLKDRYDFTVLQKIAEYFDNGIISFIAATANNFAMIATSCNVVHEYNFEIKISINDWK